MTWWRARRDDASPETHTRTTDVRSVAQIARADGMGGYLRDGGQAPSDGVIEDRLAQLPWIDGAVARRLFAWTYAWTWAEAYRARSAKQR